MDTLFHGLLKGGLPALALVVSVGSRVWCLQLKEEPEQKTTAAAAAS